MLPSHRHRDTEAPARAAGQEQETQRRRAAGRGGPLTPVPKVIRGPGAPAGAAPSSRRHSGPLLRLPPPVRSSSVRERNGCRTTCVHSLPGRDSFPRAVCLSVICALSVGQTKPRKMRPIRRGSGEVRPSAGTALSAHPPRLPVSQSPGSASSGRGSQEAPHQDGLRDHPAWERALTDGT